MSSGVELELHWGAFSAPHHGLTLSIGYGGGLGETSPLHLASLRLSQRIPHADSGDFGKTENTLYLTP